MVNMTEGVNHDHRNCTLMLAWLCAGRVDDAPMIALILIVVMGLAFVVVVGASMRSSQIRREQDDE